MRAKEILFGTSITTAAASLGILLLRLGLGAALAFGHGLGKIPPTERFIGGVEKMGFPAPDAFAWAAAASEFFGGLFIAMGLLTRPASLFAGVTVGVALFIRHAADPFEAKEKALLYLLALACLLFTGAGRFSIDGLISGKR